MSSEPSRCEGCGLPVAGGTEGCRRIFDEFRAREISELAATYASTRLTVDVYCLQHPDRYCVSAKSLAAHLTGLAWAIDHGFDEHGLRALQRALDGPLDLAKPSVPGDRGPLTIAHVASTRDAGAYLQALDAWARSTWSAYGDLQEIARAWVPRAFA